MKNRYHVLKSIDYHLIDKKTGSRRTFETYGDEWKKALAEMAKYIKKNKIGLKELYFTSSLSKYNKKTLIGKIK
jgi:hypothetical protein